MLQQYKEGVTTQQLARKHSISRRRVQQVILQASGCESGSMRHCILQTHTPHCPRALSNTRVPLTQRGQGGTPALSRPLHSQHPPRTCRACCFSYPFRRRRRFSPAGSAADPAAADQQAARCRPTHAVGNPEAIASRFCRRDHGRGTRLCRRRSRLMGSARVAWILAFRRGRRHPGVSFF